MTFLTVEDINSTINRYADKGVLHKIDTSKITEDYDYDNIQYDFVKVSRETNGSNYTYTFIIQNNGWSGGYYFTQKDGTYINASADYTDLTTLTFTTSYPSIVLVLYCTSIISSVIFKRLVCTVNPFDLNVKKTLEELTATATCKKVLLYDGSEEEMTYSQTKGVFNVVPNVGEVYRYLGRLVKTDFQFTITDSLTVGKVNKVRLGTNTKYKPNGALIGDNTPTINVLYKDKIIPVTWDNDANDYVFDLDLTHLTETVPVKLKVIVDVNDVINATETVVRLNTDYTSITSSAEFITNCSDNGSETIKITNDFTLTTNTIITHDLRIIGDNKNINMNNKTLTIENGAKVTIENVHFGYGNPTIIQQKNTELNITGCSFTNCTSDNYNQLGSCIYCDVDDESLTNPDDFITNIENCLFTNNHNCIFHGGQLLINNSKYHNTDTQFLDKHNTAFLYQTDGEATITNSIFDIDYGEDDTLCTNEETIGFAQALIQCGLTATINKANSTTLLTDNNLPFQSNASHIFAKYYYPQISACVYTSPLLGREDKAVCYTVTGENWVFKQNTQVTRASSNTQNENRKIIWED